MAIEPALPERVTLYVCDRCGRTAFSWLDIKPGHWSRGERCGGSVHRCEYKLGASQLDTPRDRL